MDDLVWLRVVKQHPGKLKMPKFVTIGYGDRAGYDRTTPEVRNAAHRHDEMLRAEGVQMGVAGAPVQVRNTDAEGVETTAGAYMSSGLPIAGFAIIEAANLAEAIDKVSRTPCAVAHGVVEVWPLKDPP
jgi:hypothetical protein